MRQRLDAAGQVVSASSYRPFGLPQEGDGGEPYGYTGEWWEGDAGLLYLRARYMQPGTGRFISRDVWGGFAGFPQSQNRYSYVHNNATRWVDPSGHAPCVSSCCEPRCYIFYFVGTGKLDNDWDPPDGSIYKRPETNFIKGLARLANDLDVVFPFWYGDSYPPGKKEEYSKPAKNSANFFMLNHAQEVQVDTIADFANGYQWLFPSKAMEIVQQLVSWGVYFDDPNLEIDFVAHSGGAHVAIGVARAMRPFKVDNVVSLGGFFRVYNWHDEPITFFSDSGELDNVGNLYDIMGDIRDPVNMLRTWRGDINDDHSPCGPFCEDLWDLDNVHDISAGTGHSSYFDDAEVWTHLQTTANLCKEARMRK